MILFPGRLTAQLVSTCANSNFNLGTFTNWVGTYGTFSNPGLYLGLDTNTNPPWPHGNFQCYNGTNKASCPPLHSIIPGPGTLDPNTGDSLLSVFPGEAFSARLGHNVGGTHAATLKYTVYVDNSTYLFIYRYAVVLQNNNHTFNQQPSFSVAVEDSTGTLIDPTCGYYYIYANDTNLGPGWHRHGPAPPALHIDWKEWTTVGISLVSYVGHHISILFTIKDCSPGGHFGYAYVSAYCSYLTIQTAMCQGDTSAVLTAPPGFAHYLWNTGDTVQQIIVPHPTTGETYNCVLTALNNCSNTIYMTLTYTVIHANFTHGNACAGLPTQFYDSSYVNQNAVTGWKWNFGDGTPVVTGNPNPQHTFTSVGIYNVKLVSNSTEGCKDSIIKAIVVDTLPAMTNNPLWKRICSRDNTNITLTSNLTTTTFTWTATSNSPLLTGWSSNTTNPTTVINQTLLNTDTKVDTVTYHITPLNSQCTGFVVNYRVAVAPLPVLTTTPLIKSICDSTSTNITLLSNNDSTLFTWVCTSNSPTLSGYSNNTTTPGTLINQLLYNSGTTIDSVTYRIIPHSFGCLGDTSNYRVAVYPFPNLSNNPPAKNICNNTATNITLTSGVAGTLFTWTCTPSSGNVFGYSNNAVPTTILNQTLFNSGSTVETVTYHIVPHANGCTGHTYNYVVTVYPVPNLSNSPLNEQICNNTPTNITLTSNVAGTLFTWTATGSSGNVSGFSDNAIPATLLNQTLINSGFNIETVTYFITPVANGCNGVVSNYVVTVYPTPDLSNTPLTKGICNNTSTGITLTTDVTGTLFTWTCTPSSGNVTGWSNNAVPTTILNQLLANTSFTDQTVTYHITPHANGCDGIVYDYIVTVHPQADLSNNPLNQQQCNHNSTNLTLTSHVAGTLFTWTCTPSSGNVTGWSNNAIPTTTLNQTLVNIGFNIETVTYHITSLANGCSGNTTNYVVTVYPTPDLTNNPLSKSQCNNLPTNITLTSNVPGTQFTWTCTSSSGNISGFSDNPVPTTSLNQVLINSGFNIENVTYHITPHAHGCDGIVYDYVVTVNPVPDLMNNPLQNSSALAPTPISHCPRM